MGTERFRGFSWLLVAVLALGGAGGVQRYVEKRRLAANLTAADPHKDALEAGFLALGGFRGVLADMLWIRAVQNNDAGKYYDLKLLCDLILRLQPTFAQVHAFLAYNQSYNLAARTDGCEEKWYWIRSGLGTLEQGLERNNRSHWLWYEMSVMYFDRLSPRKMKDCTPLVLRDLPRIESVPPEQRRHIFSGSTNWAADPRNAGRPDEHLRWAAYCCWEGLQTRTDAAPFRMERFFGQILENLGHWRSKKPPAECTSWEDWGAEDWWAHQIATSAGRKDVDLWALQRSLKFLMQQQMDTFLKGGDPVRAQAAYERFQGYFPGDKQSMDELLKAYRQYIKGAQGAQRKP